MGAMSTSRPPGQAGGWTLREPTRCRARAAVGARADDTSHYCKGVSPQLGFAVVCDHGGNNSSHRWVISGPLWHGYTYRHCRAGRGVVGHRDCLADNISRLAHPSHSRDARCDSTGDSNTRCNSGYTAIPAAAVTTAVPVAAVATAMPAAKPLAVLIVVSAAFWAGSGIHVGTGRQLTILKPSWPVLEGA